MGGFYAFRVARARNLQQQPSFINALLRGPFWVREMLIWSTLPPRNFNPVSEGAEEQERVRVASEAPLVLGDPSGAVALIQSDKDASELSAQWKPSPALEQPPVPVEPNPEFAAPAIPTELVHNSINDWNDALGLSHGIKPPVIEPVPVLAEPNDSDIPVVVPPKKLPKQPKKKGTVKVLCPWCEKKQKYASDAACPQCHKKNPWLVGAWGVQAEQSVGAVAIAEPVVEPVAEPFVETAQILLPSDAVKPKRLPGKPLWGSTMKALCPWCREKRAYHKDAICPECHNTNPWLVEKWKLEELEPEQNEIESPILPALLPPVEQESPTGTFPAPPLVEQIPQPDVHKEEPKQQPVPEVVPVDEPIVVPVEKSEEPVTTGPKSCSGCGRSSLPDLYGQCMFCGIQMGEAS